MSWAKIQNDLLTYVGKTVVDMLLPPSHPGKKALVQRIRERLEPEITVEAKARILERTLVEAAPDKKVRDVVRGALGEFLYLTLERSLTDQGFFALRDPIWTVLLHRERSGEGPAFCAIVPGMDTAEDVEAIFKEWHEWVDQKPLHAEGMILFVYEKTPPLPLHVIKGHNVGVSRMAKAGAFDASVPTFAIPDGKIEMYVGSMRAKPFWMQTLLPMLDYVKECYLPVATVFQT
ncbi:MAG: hypothetical protein HYZ53_03500 [Planctomycetes bacterium]|nr:hypothetical protein [Planctomycetota bacterium]